jgi:cob(I)alamin adenosyltransferase
MATKIYTKTGDRGLTSLLGGTKVIKSHIVVEAYGTVDELSACIGMCTAIMPSTVLDNIQLKLFHIGSLISACLATNLKLNLTQIKDTDIKELEEAIDGMQSNLPELKNFILPGGDDLISRIHLARTVCRRTERRCVDAQVEVENIDENIIKYLNRLSDYLFVMARYISHKKEIPDKIVKG